MLQGRTSVVLLTSSVYFVGKPQVYCAQALCASGYTLGMAGPAVFLPAPAVEAPPEDVKLFDARRLTLHQPASNDVSALVLAYAFQHSPNIYFRALLLSWCW